ncbi:MAG: glycosyltransferase family 2 protein [Microgenomates group bacterium]
MKLSIITPSYNQAAFLEQTITSVVSQRGRFDLEYLIMDGGSTDSSVDIIKEYAQRYPQVIKWQSKKDNGQVDAINQGVKKATGDIVAFLNSDDYYLPGSLAKVAEYFTSHPDCLWLAGDCDISQKNLTWTFGLKHLWPIDRHPLFLKLYNTINQPAVFLRSDLVKKVGKFNEKYHYAFDYDYWLRCLKYSPPHRLHQKLAVFRIHQDSKGNIGYLDQFAEDVVVTRRQTKSKKIALLHFIISKSTIQVYKLLKK